MTPNYHFIIVHREETNTRPCATATVTIVCELANEWSVMQVRSTLEKTQSGETAEKYGSTTIHLK